MGGHKKTPGKKGDAENQKVTASGEIQDCVPGEGGAVQKKKKRK